MSANHAEVDRKIAEMMGAEFFPAAVKHGIPYPPRWRFPGDAHPYTKDMLPPYSRNMHVVIKDVVPFMREQGFDFTLVFWNKWAAQFGMPRTVGASGRATDKDPAMAVCLAALKAMEVK